MLTTADLNYAHSSAAQWAEENVLHVVDEEEAAHFAAYFRLVCSDTDSLDNNIPSVFRVWRAEILPAIR